jgi:ATP-binding cassette subfamily F protein 3
MAGSESNNAAAKKDRKRLEAEQRKRQQPLRQRVLQAEEKLDALHGALAGLEKRLADPAIYLEHNKRELQECLIEKAELDKQCEAIENEWLQASEALEALVNN